MADPKSRSYRKVIDAILSTIVDKERKVSGAAGKKAIEHRFSANMGQFMDDLKSGKPAKQPFGMARTIEPDEPRSIAHFIPRWYEGGTALKHDNGKAIYNGWDISDKFNQDKSKALAYGWQEFGSEGYRYVPDNWDSILSNDLGHDLPSLVKRASKIATGDAGSTQQRYRTIDGYGDYEVAEGRKAIAGGTALIAASVEGARRVMEENKKRETKNGR